MSPTSYQAAPPRDALGTQGRGTSRDNLLGSELVSSAAHGTCALP